MDVQFWIYIIIGVIIFLSRLLKKPAQAPEESTDTRPPERRRPVHSGQTTSERPKQLTFEELLREITEGKQAQKPVPQPRFETLEDDPGDEARSLEEVNYEEVENTRPFKAYEGTKSPIFKHTSLEETMHLEDTVVDFGKFKVFENQKQKNILVDYVNIIRNPGALRQAVVMSEILKRKF